MSSSGSCKEAISDMYHKAMNASYKLFKDLNSSQSPIKTFLHLFNHMIKPSAFYGREISEPLINYATYTGKRPSFI